MSKPVCLVIGAGAGIGGNVAKKFALEGYHAHLCRRSDEAGLNDLVKQITDAGGSATGQLLNAIDDETIENVVKDIEKKIGPIEVAVYNLGAQIGDRPLADTSHKVFEMGWRLGTFGLYRLAFALTPLMEKRGRGTILVTSATSAMRGNKGQHSHAAAMGAVDAPDTLGKMLGEELFRELRESRGGEHDGLMLPEKIAETYFHIAQQHRSVWTHELDLRAYSDTAWWNHE